MKTMLAIGGSGLIVGGVVAGGAVQPSETYPLPIGQVRSELLAMPIGAPVLSAVAGSNRAGVSTANDAHSVRWTFSVRGETVAILAARLESDGADRTRIVVERVGGKSSHGYADRLMSTAFMRGIGESSLREQIDAHLEARPFDEQKAMEEFARRAVSDPDQTRELGIVMGEMFQEVNERALELQSNDGASSIRVERRIEEATRPSVRLPSSY